MFPVLLLLWLIFAGSLTLTNIILGSAVSALITLFCSKFMGYSTKGFYSSLKKLPKLLKYLLVLFKEIVMANIAVIGIIYRREEPHPNLVSFRSSLGREANRVLVANSITLTPGTFTVKLEGGDYAVHALDAPLNDGIEDNIFFRMARGLEED